MFYAQVIIFILLLSNNIMIFLCILAIEIRMTNLVKYTHKLKIRGIL